MSYRNTKIIVWYNTNILGIYAALLFSHRFILMDYCVRKKHAIQWHSFCVSACACLASYCKSYYYGLTS